MNEVFKENKITKYEKNIDNIFETMLNIGNPKDAIKFSKKLYESNQTKAPSESAPATMVYQIVEKLAEYLPEEIKNKFFG